MRHSPVVNTGSHKNHRAPFVRLPVPSELVSGLSRDLRVSKAYIFVNIVFNSSEPLSEAYTVKT